MGAIHGLEALLEGMPDLPTLGQLARELGYLLPKASVSELRELRAELAAARDRPDLARPEKALVKGVLFAMVEVCASFEAEVEAGQERQQRAAFGQEKPLYNALLHKIFAGVTRPSDLAASLGKDAAQISRALNDLRRSGLLELVTPRLTSDQRQRFHRLTTEGLRILSAQGWQASPGEPKPAELRPFESSSPTGDWETKIVEALSLGTALSVKALAQRLEVSSSQVRRTLHEMESAAQVASRRQEGRILYSLSGVALHPVQRASGG